MISPRGEKYPWRKETSCDYWEKNTCILELHSGVVYIGYSENILTIRNHSSNYFFRVFVVVCGFYPHTPVICVLVDSKKNCSFTPSFIYISFCLFQRKCSFMPSFIYFFVYSKKNVVFITSRTRNGRMSITVQYITILS